MTKIKDIIIKSPSRNAGEFYNSDRIQKINPYFPNRPVAIIYSTDARDDRIERMKSYLNSLINNANNQHQRELLAQQNRGDSEELITRIVLEEFHLYTNNSPLTIDEYKTIINYISEIGKNLLPNLHFQLSTLPVLWPNGVVQNCALYVQSSHAPGHRPLIHHMSKIKSSAIDMQYAQINSSGEVTLLPLAGDNPTLDSTYEPGQRHSPAQVLLGTAVSVSDVNQYKNTLKITSRNGIEFLQVLDICLDHAYNTGQNHLLKLIAQLQNAHVFVPYRVSHIISSKTIEAQDDNIAASVIHADIHAAKVGNLTAELANQPVKFGVGGFGQNASYDIYPAKSIGILSETNFDKAKQSNDANHYEFSINKYLGDKTLMHHVVENSHVSMNKTLTRINTLLKYNASIDIPDINNQTVRKLVTEQLITAINKNDAEQIKYYAQIAKALTMYTPMFLNQLSAIQTHGHLNNLSQSISAFCTLKSTVPAIFKSDGAIAVPNHFIPSNTTGFGIPYNNAARINPFVNLVAFNNTPRVNNFSTGIISENTGLTNNPFMHTNLNIQPRVNDTNSAIVGENSNATTRNPLLNADIPIPLASGLIRNGLFSTATSTASISTVKEITKHSFINICNNIQKKVPGVTNTVWVFNHLTLKDKYVFSFKTPYEANAFAVALRSLGIGFPGGLFVPAKQTFSGKEYFIITLDKNQFLKLENDLLNDELAKLVEKSIEAKLDKQYGKKIVASNDKTNLIKTYLKFDSQEERTAAINNLCALTILLSDSSSLENVTDPAFRISSGAIQQDNVFHTNLLEVNTAALQIIEAERKRQLARPSFPGLLGTNTIPSNNAANLSPMFRG